MARVKKASVKKEVASAKKGEKTLKMKQVMTDPEYKTLKAFIVKKATEMYPTDEKLARNWVAAVLKGWAGNRTFEKIRTNERKMEVAFRIWKSRFFGYGLYGPEKENVEEYRAQLKEELKMFDHKASKARKKHEKKKRESVQGIKDSTNEDSWTVEAAKLANDRTVNKNVDVRKTIRAPSAAKKGKKKAPPTPKEAKAPPIIKQEIITIDDDTKEESEEESSDEESEEESDPFPFEQPSDEAIANISSQVWRT